MRRTGRLPRLGVLAWVLIGPALVPGVWAQPRAADGPAGAAAPLDVRVADGKVSLDVRDAPLAALLRTIGERADVRVHLQGELSARVTRSFTGVPVEQAIRRLARGHSLSFAYAGPERLGAPGRLTEVWVIPASPRTAPGPPPQASAGERASALQTVRALGLRRDPAATAELVRLLAGDSDPVVRSQAASALGRASDPSSASALLGALADPDPSVRIQALYALRRVAGEQATDPTARLLATDPDPRVRRSAVWMLGGLTGPAADAALRAAAAGDADASVRRSASAVLARRERVR